MKGRATGIQHRSIKEDAKIPVFGFDYFSGTQVISEEDEEEKILVAKCQLTKCTFAHCVPQEEIDPALYVVQRFKRDVLWLGHTKIMLTSDNENAILAFRSNNLTALRIGLHNTQQTQPAAYDSSSNATTEATCRTVAGMARIIKARLEDRIKRRIPASHCIFYCLVEQAAWLFNIRTNQSDGITPYKRVRGMNFHTRMLGFGESCLYKLSKKAHTKSMDGKMCARWRGGTFFGLFADSPLPPNSVSAAPKGKPVAKLNFLVNFK